MKDEGADKALEKDDEENPGDAIQFFMQQEVAVAEGAMSPVDPSVNPSTPHRWAPKRQYWYMAVRRSVWLWTMVPCVLFVAAVVATIIALHESIFHLNWHVCSEFSNHSQS